MDINKDLEGRLNKLPPDISYLAREIILAIEKGKSNTQIEEFILGEINEIIREGGL